MRGYEKRIGKCQIFLVLVKQILFKKIAKMIIMQIHP